MALIERKTITSGTSGTASGWCVGGSSGAEANQFGTIGDLSSGGTTSSSSAAGISGGNNLFSLFWQSNTLTMRVIGASDSNLDWNELKIGSTTFNRDDATVTTGYVSGQGSATAWTWSTTTNPLTSGQTFTCSWYNNLGGMTSYAFTDSTVGFGNNSSRTQNVGTYDNIEQTLSWNYGYSIRAINCTVSFVAGNSGGSTSGTGLWNISFIEAGAWSAEFYQGYGNSTYTISGTATGNSNWGYGLQVLDASGNIRLNINHRQPRVVGSFIANGSNASFFKYWPGYNNPVGEWTAVQVKSGSNYSVDLLDTTTNYIRMKRADVRTSNASFQVLDGDEAMKVIVFRY